MTLTNAYATLVQFKSFMRLDDSEDDARCELSISAASRQIDRFCGRPFWVTSSEARTYDAVDDSWLAVDDISSTTGLVVKIDGDADGSYETTLTITTDFLVEPLNAAKRYPVEPYTSLRMVGDYTWPRYNRPCVQVTALFGWPAVPDEVTDACLLQARQLYKSHDAQFGAFELGVSGVPMRIRRMDPSAEALLEPFRKVEV